MLEQVGELIYHLAHVPRTKYLPIECNMFTFYVMGLLLWGHGLHDYVLYCIQRTYPKLLNKTKQNLTLAQESRVEFIIWCTWGSKPSPTSPFSRHFPIILNCFFDKGSPQAIGSTKEWEDRLFGDKTASPWPRHFKHSHWWKRRSWSKFAPHYTWGTNGVCECKMDVESTWIPKWHRMDHISSSLGLLSKATSWR